MRWTGQLTDGVVAAAVGPFGLLGGEAFNGDIRWNKPLLLVVGGAQLLQQYALECGSFLGLLGENLQGKCQHDEDNGSLHVFTSSTESWRTGNDVRCAFAAL